MATTPRIEVRDGVTIVTFGPEYKSIDEMLVGTVTEAMSAVGQSDPPLFCVDLSHTTFFGSSFIEQLNRAWTQLKTRSGHMAISGLQEYCREVLEITNLDSVWILVATQDDAVRELKSRYQPDS